MIQVSEKIQSLDSIIEDLITYCNREDPDNDRRLSDILEIRSKYIQRSEDLETEYRRVSESLTINDLRILSIEDWRDQISDPETRESLSEVLKESEDLIEDLETMTMTINDLSVRVSDLPYIAYRETGLSQYDLEDPETGQIDPETAVKSDNDPEDLESESENGDQ